MKCRLVRLVVSSDAYFGVIGRKTYWYSNLELVLFQGGGWMGSIRMMV